MSSTPVIEARPPAKQSPWRTITAPAAANIAERTKAYKAGYATGQFVRNIIWGPASGQAMNLKVENGHIFDQFRRTAASFSAYAGEYLLRPVPDPSVKKPYLVPESFESPYRATIFGFVYNDPKHKDGEHIGFTGINSIRMKRRIMTAGGNVIKLEKNPREISTQMSGLAAG